MIRNDYETRFTRLPRALARMEELAGMTFADAVADGRDAAMETLANAIASKFAGCGFEYGVHADNAIECRGEEGRVAVRLKDGHGVIVYPDNGACDGSRDIDEMEPLDFVMFATDVSCSYNGTYMLVRYDQLACYANPFMKSSDDIWDFWCPEKGGLLSECRSVVVDVAKLDGDPADAIVSLPYYKFRNLGECEGYSLSHVRKAIDESSGKFIATEKLDGSMIQMRYIEGEDRDGGAFPDGLLLTTSKTLAGSSKAEGNGHIDAVRRYHLVPADEKGKYLGVAKAYPGYTFIYEFVRPSADRHVVVYSDDKCGLYMTGARDVKTGKLAKYDEIAAMASEYSIPYPRVIATDIDTALAYQKDGDGAVCEGMVANIGEDSSWLVKIKLDGFLALSHVYHDVEGGAGFKNIAKMLWENTLDDAMAVLPDELRSYIDAVVARLVSYDGKMRETVRELLSEAPDPSCDRKAFALYVNSLGCPKEWKGWLFQSGIHGEIDCFWCDEKGGERRFLAQGEFEKREAILEEWLREK